MVDITMPATRSVPAWRILVLAFLAMNCALGIDLGAYGTLVHAMERDYGTSRAMAASGSSMLTISMGLLSPLIGGLIRRYPLRLIMAAGALLNGLGYALLTATHQATLMLVIYGLLIGPGFCLLSVIPCTTLVSNWFPTGKGRAIGIMNMPFGNTVFPIIFATTVQFYGLTGAFWLGAAIMVSLAPLLFFLVEDRPKEVLTRRDEHIPSMAAGLDADPLTSRQLLATPSFWVLTIGMALLTGGSLAMLAHLAVLAQGRGLSLEQASLVVATLGLAGVFGAPLLGSVADKIGGGRSLAVNALLRLLPWTALLFVGHSLPSLLVIAFLIGITSNSELTLFGATTGNWLGTENLSLAMGLSYLFQIPFIFGAAPLAGAMYERTGSYDYTIILHDSTFVVIGLLFLFYAPPPNKRVA
ncbi:MFS transporter [Burkholderia multivorans]|uniref:MFS transporter n=1 Tax=Burkholderia multivorans TaxID=87883 RepID=UPI0021C18518|nr:MFS transporter [Burkholderia multivorans]